MDFLPLWQFGYPGLFVFSFLAATLLPLSSEVAVALMPALGYDLWLTLLFATLGNTGGVLFNYWMGAKGADFIFARYVQVAPESLQRARRLYGRWGIPVLFFSWLPIIGDPLTVLGGVLRVPLPVFTFWVVLGRSLRYAVVLGLIRAIFGWG